MLPSIIVSTVLMSPEGNGKLGTHPGAFTLPLESEQSQPSLLQADLTPCRESWERRHSDKGVHGKMSAEGKTVGSYSAYFRIRADFLGSRLRILSRVLSAS